MLQCFLRRSGHARSRALERGQKKTRQSRPWQLRVESLEDRCLPSLLHTLAFNEITSFPDGLRNLTDNQGPILSAAGNRAAFADAPGHSHTDARYNDIFVINSDGTGQQMVDSYEQFAYSDAEVDISADGSRVVSTDSVQIRSADVGGSGGQAVIAFDSNSVRNPRISVDGSKIFFLLRADTNIRGTSMREERGLYVINPDGSGLQQVVTPSQIGDLIGIPAENVVIFGVDSGSSLALSSGDQIVFGTINTGVPDNTSQRMFGVQADGSGLHELDLPPRVFVIGMGISGDGSTVSYNIAPPSSSPSEVGVENFDGTGRHTLTTSATSYPIGFPGSGDRIQLSNDGSKLLLGSTSVLIDTVTGAQLQLATTGNFYSGDTPRLVYDGMFRASMDSTATHFLYISGDAQNVQQLATLDIDPLDLGSAPLIVDPAINPASIPVGGAQAATVSAGVLTAFPDDKIIRVSNAIRFDGLDNSHVNHAVLLDDGTGVFSSDRITADSVAVPGPRIVRIKVEVVDSAGRRHATAVDFDPFEVVAPAGPSARRRDPSTISPALLVASGRPDMRAPNTHSSATETSPPSPGVAPRSQEDLAVLSVEPSRNLRMFSSGANDTLWTALRYEDWARSVDWNAWAAADRE
jgi:hypothetical protein